MKTIEKMTKGRKTNSKNSKKLRKVGFVKNLKLDETNKLRDDVPPNPRTPDVKKEDQSSCFHDHRQQSTADSGIFTPPSPDSNPASGNDSFSETSSPMKYSENSADDGVYAEMPLSLLHGLDDEKKLNFEVDPREEEGDPNEMLLNNAWTMYYLQRKKMPVGDMFGESCNHKICDVKTVAQFWHLMSMHPCDDGKIKKSPGENIQIWFSLPQKLHYKRMPSISFFRRHVEPKWEDPGHEHGGEWRLELKEKSNRNELDSFWLETLMALVGEYLGPAEISKYVTGVTVQRRSKEDRLKLWTYGVSNPEENKKLQERIASEWWEILRIKNAYSDSRSWLTYVSHKQMIQNDEDQKAGKVVNRSNSIAITRNGIAY